METKLMDKLKQWFEHFNGRLIYAVAMLGSAVSLTLLPNAQSQSGVIGFIENFWDIQRMPLALVFAFCGLWVFFRKPIGIWYIVATAPMAFYIFATFLYIFQTPTNMTVLFFYMALYLRILMDTSKP